MISAETAKAWDGWFAISRSRCHLHFEVEGGSLQSHLEAGLHAGHDCALRVAGETTVRPSRILEVGSSVGFNCFGLAQHFPTAQVHGVEPDAEAVDVARRTAADLGISNAAFDVGVGERLPFADASFDLIVCHTVIEHVQNVDQVLVEMARVLRPGGQLHLEAPNYIWPEEPHVRIVMPPLCPKPLMRLLGRLQGRSADLHYVDHLQLVHPIWIERCFRHGGLHWVNLVEQKLRRAADGDLSQIAAYRRAAQLLAALRRWRLDRLAIRLLLTFRLYPSLIYTATKPDA